MTLETEPEFLSREIIDAIHDHQISTRGRIRVVVFLEGCGIDTSRLPEEGTFDALTKVANHEMDRRELGSCFRQHLPSQ